MKSEFNFHEFKIAERLPSPSGTALAIMKLVQQPNSNLDQIAQLVKADPALSGRILKFVNSAAFGSPRSLVNVNEAVKMMGMQSVRNFALSLSLIGNKDGKSRCEGFDYNTYWSKSLAAAVALAALSVKNRIVSSEEGFTFGLLAEIGQLALATAWSSEYGSLLKVKGQALLTLEHEHFSINHNELTLMLIAEWGVSDIFLEALDINTDFKYEGEQTRAVKLARQLNFSQKIAQYCLANDSYRVTLLTNFTEELAAHNFDNETFTTFLNDVIVQWQEWGKLIDVPTNIRYAELENVTPQLLLPALNVLLVDDDAIMLTRLSKQLTLAGHRVSVCRDGESALKHIIDHEPDLILTDWKMQPMDGLSLCRTLRSSTWGNSVYIIMITSTIDEDSLVEAFEAGVDDYVTKPVNLKILLSRIRAGQRIVMLQQALEKENKDLQNYMAKLAVANRRLELMANTDALTGLANRRYALQRLEQEWLTAQRFQRSLSVLMLDLDHFKSVNDTFGHDAGDKVLIHVSNIIQKVCRSSDIACRLGGEEFLVISPNTEGSTAVLLAQRIRQTIEQHQFKDLKLSRPVTVSIGVAGSSGDGRVSSQDLIKLADQALYDVKRSERNSVKLTAKF